MAYQPGCRGGHDGGSKGIAAAAAARGQSQSVRVFFPAQFAPFLHRNPELLVDGFDNFLGNPLVHSCLKGTNIQEIYFLNFPVDFYNICSNLHSNCLNDCTYFYT